LHNGGSKRRKTYRPCKLVIDVNQFGIEPVRALFSKCLAFPEVKLSVMDDDFGLLFTFTNKVHSEEIGFVYLTQ
jgi:hypothetical protein